MSYRYKINQKSELVGRIVLCASLLSCEAPDYLGYWTNERSTAEVDFLVQHRGEVILVEVKAEENLRAKSFKLFCDTFQPRHAIRTSMRPYHEEPWMTNIPLYGIAHGC